MANLIADKTYYLNADKTAIVEEGSPDAAWLLVAEGGEIAQEEADKYGLKINTPKVEEAQAEPVAEPVRRQTKRSPGPSEDK